MEATKYKVPKIFPRDSNLSSVLPSEVLMAFEILTEQQVSNNHNNVSHFLQRGIQI